MEKYYENFNRLGDHWQHVIFTDLGLKSQGNITVVKMDNKQFMDLVENKIGIRPYVPAPSPKFGDLRPAFGAIFNDYTKGFDFWGHTDFDIVLGDLDKFLTDEFLKDVEIYSNHTGIVNGIFALYQNKPTINSLFSYAPGWIEIFQDTRYHGFDEEEFSRFVKTSGMNLKSNYWQEHDKMAIHTPKPQLELRGKGLFNKVTGEEILCFHFKRTKEYPV